MPIVERILAAFAAPEPAPLPELDADLALGALMVRVAKSDAQYLAEEISQIDQLLAEMNALNPVEAAKMRATCERLEKAAPETESFAEIIRRDVPKAKRHGALRAMWRISLADGVQRPEEKTVVKAAQRALGLTAADSKEAREEAQIATAGQSDV